MPGTRRTLTRRRHTSPSTMPSIPLGIRDSGPRAGRRGAVPPDPPDPTPVSRCTDSDPTRVAPCPPPPTPTPPLTRAAHPTPPQPRPPPTLRRRVRPYPNTPVLTGRPTRVPREPAHSQGNTQRDRREGVHTSVRTLHSTAVTAERATVPECPAGACAPEPPCPPFPIVTCYAGRAVVSGERRPVGGRCHGSNARSASATRRNVSGSVR
jgi:hypothetical protein